MTACEMCGKNATTKAKIEGTILSVCASCASFGSPIGPEPKIFKPQKQGLRSEESTTYIAADAGQILRDARRKRNINEEDAAKLLGLHKSTLLHLEAGKIMPDEITLKKLEKFYGVSLKKPL